jgi:hypothetical protein
MVFVVAVVMVKVNIEGHCRHVKALFPEGLEPDL